MFKFCCCNLLDRGCFQTEKFGLLAGLMAHTSGKASEEVIDLASHLPESLNFLVVPLLDVLPGYYNFSSRGDGVVDLNIFPEDEKMKGFCILHIDVF